MELRQACVVAASDTHRGLTSVKPWGCPGGCGLCCGVTRLAGSGSVHGLVAADVERSRCLYDPCCWSWEQLRQLIASPTQAGFHVVHMPIRDNGEIPAANGSFDMALLPVVPATVPISAAVVQSLVRCVRSGGLVAIVQPPLTACQSACAQTPIMATSAVARCVELLRKHGCRNISMLNAPQPPRGTKNSSDGPDIDYESAYNCKSAHPVAVVAQVGVLRRKDSL